MGLDARIYIEGIIPEHIGPELKAAIGAQLSSWSSEQQCYVDMRDGWTCIEGMERFFSAGYPRGEWPKIREAIQIVRAAFPGKRVLYGSDHDDGPGDAEPVTDEVLARIDAEWLAIPPDPMLEF